MTTLDLAMLQAIDQRVAAGDKMIVAMGTVAAWSTSTPTDVMVTFDGTTLAVPCKLSGSVVVVEGDRVALIRPGRWWIVVSTFTRPTGVVDVSANALVSAASGGFVKGSSTYTARYLRTGPMVYYAGKVTINTGGGFATGTGVWNFLLPVTAAATLLGTGAVLINDSGTVFADAIASVITSTTAQFYQHAVGHALDSGGPGTAWATNDFISWSMWYEAA